MRTPGTTSRTSAIVLLSLLCLVPASGSAQVAGSLTDSIDVRVVNVEAVVTDKSGARVFGLWPDDFRLVVDGEEVPIDYFTEVRGGQALLENGSQPFEAQPITAGQARGTSYLVFIDDFFSREVDRRRVLRALEDELGYLGEQDRLAVVAWDGEQVDLLSNWSRSTRELERALKEADRRPAYGLHRYSELRQAVNNPAFRRSRGELNRRLNIVERIYVSQLTDQLDRMVAAASATLRSFAMPPGRKVMLLVSGGWPYSPAAYVEGTPIVTALDDFYDSGQEIYAPLVETANLLGYTLYPVDAPGLEGSSRADASRAGFASLVDTDFYREDEQHQTLRYLAYETGGRALLNGKRSRPMAAAFDDTRSFYWLGFTADRKGDGAERDIRVELKRGDLKVRARRSYTDLSKSQEVAMAVESTLLFGDPPASGALRVDFGSQAPMGRGKMAVPVTVHIPLDQVALVPTGRGEYGADLEVRVVAKGRNGARSEIPLLPVAIRHEGPAKSGESFAYEATLRMRRQAHDLVIALYDPVSGEIWSSSAVIEPQAR